MNVRSSYLVTPVTVETSRWARIALTALAVLLVGLLTVTSLVIGSVSAQAQVQTTSTLAAGAVSTCLSQSDVERSATAFPEGCDSGFCELDCINVGELCTPGSLSTASTWSLHRVILPRAIPSATPRVVHVIAQRLIEPEPPSLIELSISRT